MPVHAKITYDKKMQLGQLLYYNKNVDQAIKAFRTASALKPTAFEPHLNLVNIYVQKKEISQAIAECHEVLKIKSKHRDVHLILGNLLRRQVSDEQDPDRQKKLLEEAEEEVNRAQSLGADRALVHNTLGIIKVQQGKHDEAMKHMEQALLTNPKLPDAHRVLAVLYFKRGDKEQALHHLDLAIKQKDGKNAEAWNTQADILFTMDKLDEALEAYKKSIEADPSNHQAWAGMANIYFKRKEFENFKECTDKVRALTGKEWLDDDLKEKNCGSPGYVGDFYHGILRLEPLVLPGVPGLHTKQIPPDET